MLQVLNDNWERTLHENFALSRNASKIRHVKIRFIIMNHELKYFMIDWFAQIIQTCAKELHEMFVQEVIEKMII